MNSDLNEIVYIRFLDRFRHLSFCIRLLRSLYRLQRSLLLWFTDFTATLRKLRLQLILEAKCLYINTKLIVFFFVDDIAILYRTTNISVYKSFRTLLFKHYEMRDLRELKWFLGIRIICDRPQRKI